MVATNTYTNNATECITDPDVLNNIQFKPFIKVATMRFSMLIHFA